MLQGALDARVQSIEPIQSQRLGRPKPPPRRGVRPVVAQHAVQERQPALLVELEKQIPPDIPWVLRVDGHTDVRPIATLQFP